MHLGSHVPKTVLKPETILDTTTARKGRMMLFRLERTPLFPLYNSSFLTLFLKKNQNI